ncbi:hypothetical protein A5798_000031 [Enterococcus sp. 6C8_DIV0013]|nr:hypothetical protein A5798_000031 [Enterococcus sp. 6C8_DIV0013]
MIYFFVRRNSILYIVLLQILGTAIMTEKLYQNFMN